MMNRLFIFSSLFITFSSSLMVFIEFRRVPKIAAENKYLTQDALWFNQTLDHFSPTVGNALKELFSTGVVKRSDLWITSKLWCSDHTPEDVSKALSKTLEDLQLDYVDLYLVTEECLEKAISICKAGASFKTIGKTIRVYSVCLMLCLLKIMRCLFKAIHRMIIRGQAHIQSGRIDLLYSLVSQPPGSTNAMDYTYL